MMAKLYVELIEYNDWEGETWSFWIPVPGNEDAIESLRHILTDSFAIDCFEMGETLLSESKLDFLIKRSKGETSYLSRHNKLRGVLKLPDKTPGEVIDAFYKGGIREMVKPARKKAKK